MGDLCLFVRFLRVDSWLVPRLPLLTLISTVPAPFSNPLTAKVVDFLLEIGIQVEPAQVPAKTFLPGILVRNGSLLVDEPKLLYPGDLLHEAGHLAVAPAAIRAQLSDEVELPEMNMDTVEAASIAWSYAAALHLSIDPAVVFHPQGYLGHASGLLFSFNLGVYPGANGLQDRGMAVTGARAQELGLAPFPHMIKWLCD
jgi:hypothetical protein